MAAIDETCRIVSHEATGPGYRILVLAAPRVAAEVVPGQFVHVKVPDLEDSALRRPFSVFDADVASGTLTLLYKVVGRGTEALARAAAGGTLRVLGPLGHGFPSACAGVPLLVGGGYGVAPIHFLAKRMRVAGSRPVVFVGGRTAGDLLAVEEFRAMGADLRLATNDGSAGEKGFVTEPLDAELAACRARGAAFELFVCGPDGLLKAVAQRAVGTGSKGWISMDRHMVCGVGACFACIQTIKGPDGQPFNARCCVNGPVFRAADVVWPEEGGGRPRKEGA